MKSLWILFHVGVLSLAFLFAPSLRAEDQIKFAGIWLSGRLSEAKLRLPVGAQLSHRVGNSASADVSKALLAELRKEQRPGGRIVDLIAPDDFIPNAAMGRAYVMACALNYEHVESYVIGGVTKALAEIGFDLVICDFSQRSVIVCIPGRCLLVDALNGPLSEDRARNLLEQLYSNNLTPQFLRLAKANFEKIRGSKCAGVTKVTIMDGAKAVLPKWIVNRNADYYANLAGSNFYDAVGLPMIPASGGNEMLFNSMRENLADVARLAENSIREAGPDGVPFILRKPDYQVELVIPGFQDVVADKSPAGQLVQNCAYSRITVKQGEEVLYSEKHRSNVRNIIPTGSHVKTGWLPYQEATSQMFYEAAKQMAKNTSSTVAQFFIDCSESH